MALGADDVVEIEKILLEGRFVEVFVARCRLVLRVIRIDEANRDRIEAIPSSDPSLIDSNGVSAQNFAIDVSEDSFSDGLKVRLDLVGVHGIHDWFRIQILCECILRTITRFEKLDFQMCNKIKISTCMHKTTNKPRIKLFILHKFLIIMKLMEISNLWLVLYII